MTVSGDMCMRVHAHVLRASFFLVPHKHVGAEEGLAVPDRAGQGMPSYVGGSSEVD